MSLGIRQLGVVERLTDVPNIMTRRTPHVAVFKSSFKKGAAGSVQRWQVSEFISECVDETVSYKHVRQSDASHSLPLHFALYRNKQFLLAGNKSIQATQDQRNWDKI